MSADPTSKDDNDDAEFRARLAPLASEVLPGGAALGGEAIGGTRLRLIARVGNAVEETGDAASAAAARIEASRSDTVDAARLEAVRRDAARLDAARPGAPRRSTGLSWGIVVGAAVVSGVVFGGAWFIQGPPSVWLPSRVVSRLHLAMGKAPPPAGDAAARTSDAAAAVPAAGMIELLMRRGDAALAVGDIIAARLLYERAAALGSAAAATAAGKTYDTDFLLRAGARGIRADPATAAAWYRKAIALGDPEASARLAPIKDAGGPPGGSSGAR